MLTACTLRAPSVQVNSIEEADKKIDELAAGGKLSPALLLTMAKAYAGVKETDLTQEEVKDIMAHLYFKVCRGHCTESAEPC